MLNHGQVALAIGGALSGLAAMAHLACIFIGAPAYRFMGAGEDMASAAERGRLQPTLVTLFISAVLVAWALFAFSGAGLLPRLPLVKMVLVAVTGVYLLRALAFPLIRPLFPGNSMTFWLVSSGVCLVIGVVHLYGLLNSWQRL